MSYTVGPLPFVHDAQELANAVWDELSKIDAGDHELVLEELNVAPVKPLNGALYLADGTNWDPGAGRGVYWWDKTGMVWKLLG